MIGFPPPPSEVLSMILLVAILSGVGIWVLESRWGRKPAVATARVEHPDHVRRPHDLTLRTPTQTYRITIGNVTQSGALEVARGIAALCLPANVEDAQSFVLVADQIYVRAGDVRAIVVEPRPERSIA